ncbi:hypothetical protein [Pseudomonas syringae]|uniref:hypothetical protein n=1 Tax=Pseudomonas syringae TaxID=317 RepID=UPI00165D5E44|nr:hypothetical protein [Pseudomonas syringae]QNR42572.1 hypothetical protein D5S12_14980 [Pseudomonas syringae]
MDPNDLETKVALAKEELRATLSENVTKAELFALIQPLWMANVKLVSAILEAMTSLRILGGDNEKASQYAENAWAEMPEVLERLEKMEPSIRAVFPGLLEAQGSPKKEGPVNE